MDYQKETKDTFDEQWSEKYRDADEKAVGHGSRKHYCDMLQKITGSFDRKISVLDAGCGTGRYFHCLNNISRLVGMDISSQMLEQARNPVNVQEQDIETIDLLCGDILSVDLSDQSFDLIYSIGVLGEYSPINLSLLNKLFGLLNTGGTLFLTAVDIHSRMQMPENKQPTIARRALRKIFPHLPLKAKEYLNRTVSTYYLTKEDLERLLRESEFTECSISRYKHPYGWPGTHYDCIAHKR